jgi:serine protease Do
MLSYVLFLGRQTRQLLEKIIKFILMTDFGPQIKAKSLILALLLLLNPLTAQAFERRTPVVAAIETVGPAVVNISSEYEVEQRSPFGHDPFFNNFFRDFFEPRTQKRSSLGSGVIIDGGRGFILTNAHVIEKRAVIKVILQDERQFEASIVGIDPDSDLAVLKINTDEPLPAVPMGDSDDLLIGETVIAIGNPFGFSHTVTTGVISALKRSIKTDARIFHEFIQTDASINPGNSGGPLLNINGQLIGINTAIYAKAQGIGFAIPINRAKRIVNDLIQFGHVVQAWIGILVQDLDRDTAEYFKLKESGGVAVTVVEKESPAAQAGMQAGDLILAFAGRKIGTSQDFYTATRALSAGEKFTLLLRRKGRELTRTIQAEVFPEARAPELAWRRLGVKVSAADGDKGVLITALRKESALARVGVTHGDIVHQIDDATIKSVVDFHTAIIRGRLKSSLTLLLQRHNQLYRLTVTPEP